MKNKKNHVKGITLIALVVTIVVLLILAGVSISMLTGENGIITQASRAKERTEIEQEKEWITLSCMSLTSQQREINDVSLESEIELISNKDVSVSGMNTLTVVYKDSKRKYKVENGKIIEDGVKTEEILLFIERDRGPVADKSDMILYIDLSQFDIYENISYEDYAKKVLKGKTDQEKEKIFIDGCSYWDMLYGDIDTSYTSLEEIFSIYYDWGWTNILCETIEDLVDDWGYNTINELLINETLVNPQCYDFNNEAALPIDGITIDLTTPDGEQLKLQNKFEFEYTVTDNKECTFMVSFEGKNASITENVDNIMKLENVSKHPDQDESETIGVDEDGNPVNMDLWYYYLVWKDEYSSYYDLTKTWTDIYGNLQKGGPAYIGRYVNGEIEGKIPMFIKEEGKEFFPVKEMTSTFVGEEGLKIMPQIPPTVIEMKDTFRNCINLVEVAEISKCIMGEGVFHGCSALTSITIPNNVTEIGSSTFSGCTGLTSVTISNNVTRIGGYAFSGCTGLTSITIPNNVTTIESGIFDECTGLTSVTISNNVTSIKDHTFSGCTGLTNITIPNNITWIGDYAFSGCTGLTNIVIPNNVRTIAYAAFSKCTGLTSITIPNSVTSIAQEVFSGCTGLTSITLPNKIKTIESGTFSGCTGLINIIIPSSVTNIEWDAFLGCTGLTSITIPNSVTSIDHDAFSGCTSLITVNYTGTEEEWNKISIDSGNTNLTNATINYNYKGE